MRLDLSVQRRFLATAHWAYGAAGVAALLSAGFSPSEAGAAVTAGALPQLLLSEYTVPKIGRLDGIGVRIPAQHEHLT